MGKHGISRVYGGWGGAMDLRVENQNAIDACIAGTLPDLTEVRARINKLKFLPYSHVDKRTTLTYLDQNGSWNRVSKNAPEQVFEFMRKEAWYKPYHSLYGDLMLMFGKKRIIDRVKKTFRRAQE
nr:plasma membrane ATPase 4-like [Tanacetum cinerariifolium]